MVLLLKKAAKFYIFFNHEVADPRTNNWLLMKSPFPGLALIGLYLYIVLKWGPKFMESRKPFDLKKLIIVYNIIQIAACTYIVYQALRLGWGTHYSFICQPVDFSNSPEAIEFAYKVCYCYFWVKFIDLLDTIFFVLRKKQGQVSFLHVYHHAGMVVLSWGMVKWQPGGHCSFLALINSFVHIIMYSYYLLTALNDSFKQSLWWKKYVTQLQIFQFSILLFQFSSLLWARECKYPRFPAFILIPQNLFMLLLFSDFYYRTYIRKPKTQ